jgi:hypothetical protein
MACVTLGAPRVSSALGSWFAGLVCWVVVNDTELDQPARLIVTMA